MPQEFLMCARHFASIGHVWAHVVGAWLYHLYGETVLWGIFGWWHWLVLFSACNSDPGNSFRSEIEWIRYHIIICCFISQMWRQTQIFVRRVLSCFLLAAVSAEHHDGWRSHSLWSELVGSSAVEDWRSKTYRCVLICHLKIPERCLVSHFDWFR